jgi:hypothetical protein
MADRGIDALRNIASGVADVSHAFSSAAEGAPLNIVSRGVVSNILSDLSAHDLDALAADVINPKFLDSAPRNSIIARIVTAGEDKRTSGALLCFPFFPPHMCFPVKPGEQVWIMIENPDGTPELGYWMCRVPEPDFVDDVNYTHGDRKFSLDTGEKTTAEKADEADPKFEATTDVVPGYPNGSTENSETQTLTEEDAYEQIYTGSLSAKSFVAEPVPRFTKRPGDLVLQGSNNTLICLGQDRGWTKDDRPKEPTQSNASVPLTGEGEIEEKKEIPGFSGTIDVVTGRGRYFKDPDPEIDPENWEGPSTQARVIKNARETLEADKNPVSNSKGDQKKNYLIDPAEGDPDFLHDASRIYVSMKTKADANFGLSYPQVPAVDDDTNAGVDTPLVPETDEDPGTPHIVIKSDEIRIIARQAPVDDPDSDPKIQGSIKIIKEGVADDEEGKGRAVIMIQPDGTIMIDGPKIVIGSGIEKGNGEGNQVALGLGATEPVVLGEILKQKLEAYMDAVSAAFTYASTHVHPTGTGPSGPPTGEQWSAEEGNVSTTKGELKEILSKLAKTL